MSDPLESTEHSSRARAHEGAELRKCGCWQDAAGTLIMCPHHSRFEEDGTPRDARVSTDAGGKDSTAQEIDRAATLLGALAGDPRPFVAAFDFELNASGLSGRKRAFLYTLVRMSYKGKAYAYAGVAPSTVSAWRKNDAIFSALEQLAEALHLEALEAEADRRAFEGVLKPVFGKLEGKEAGSGIIGYIREYDSALLQFRMRAIAPEKYRERADKDKGGASQPDVEQLRTDLASKLKRAAEAKRPALSPASQDSESETP